MIKYRIVLELI